MTIDPSRLSLSALYSAPRIWRPACIKALAETAAGDTFENFWDYQSRIDRDYDCGGRFMELHRDGSGHSAAGRPGRAHHPSDTVETQAEFRAGFGAGRTSPTAAPGFILTPMAAAGQTRQESQSRSMRRMNIPGLDSYNLSPWDMASARNLS